MKILLLKNLKKIGDKGDVIMVRNGYAKNYLIPKEYAIKYTKDSYEKNKYQNEKTIESILIENDITVIIPVKKKTEQEIYGAINSNKISKIIRKLKLKINVKHLPNDLNITKFSNYKLELNDKKLNKKTNIYIMLINIK